MRSLAVGRHRTEIVVGSTVTALITLILVLPHIFGEQLLGWGL